VISLGKILPFGLFFIAGQENFENKKWPKNGNILCNFLHSHPNKYFQSFDADVLDFQIVLMMYKFLHFFA
jgi:hypothetical protein